MFDQFRSIVTSIALALGLTFSGTVHANTDPPHYRLIDTLHLTGPTRWDYLTFDALGQRLFITRGERVEVLDVTARKIVGSIPDTHGAHGVALAPELGKGFISNGASNAVTVFDMATFKPLLTVPTGAKPDAIVYDAATQRVFAANAGSGDMTAINAHDNTVAGTIKLGGKPEFAVVDGKGELYVNLQDKSQLVVLDTKALKVMARYDLGPNCHSPTGLAIDISLRRLFATCGNQVMVVVDAVTGKMLDTLPIGAHSDAALFDPGTKLAFSSNGDGTLTVVSAAGSNHYAVMQTVQTLPTARTMALDPATHQIYLAAAHTAGFDAPTAQRLQPRPHIQPDTFMILIVGPSPLSPPVP